MLVVTIRAVTTAAFAAITAFEVVLLRKNDEALFGMVKFVGLELSCASEPVQVITHLVSQSVWLTKVGRKSYSDAYLRGMQYRRLVPNSFTMANLVCGTLAIYFMFTTDSYTTPALLIGLAAVLDLFDGLAARMLNVDGPMGKQLDSLADAVTFGVAPALMIVHLTDASGANPSPWQLYAPLLLAVASVYRLAKFNIDERQSDQFRGLPTPANALFWISTALYWQSGAEWSALVRPELIFPTVLLMSAFMISDIPLIALKFKSYDLDNNRYRYLLIGLSILAVAGSALLLESIFPAVPIVLILYLLISLLNRRSMNNHDLSRRN